MPNPMITIDTPTKPISAYLSLPETSTPSPGVVVIHEIFGLTDNICETADRFAKEGYVAVAVDLFSGRPKPICIVRTVSAIFRTPSDRGVAGDLKGALDFLAQHPQVDATRLGVIGFCMGGSFALQIACVDDRLKASSVFYGNNPKPLDLVAQACPIVGSYPEKDFTTKDAKILEAKLEEAEVVHDIKIYPGAKHSFFNSSREKSYDADAAHDAWQRTLSFFHRQFHQEA